MKIDPLIQWMAENKDLLNVTEVLAPMWEKGLPHLVIVLESSTWNRVKARACVEPALGCVKEDETKRTAWAPSALLSKSVKRRLYVQTKAGKTSRKLSKEVGAAGSQVREDA